ncbi:1739_t:CDS:2 [Cetraspora pellucida]|uniref:1739_t:CDS:1 n=1 Tax=Cetraspora pellucida TaxID=1433469 RepID=A0A9N8WJ07_9GLOM|nr:1739_t:CDS:2 [Cetraspora pellucida]
MEHLSGPQLIQKAGQLISENKLDEAVKIFGFLVEKLPDAYLPLLSSLIQLERYEEAKIDAPGNTTLHSVGYARLAKCYKELGQVEEAEKLLRKRQELEKKVISQKLRLQGNELYKKQKYNESLEKYLKAFEMNPNDLLVNSNCAQVYLKLGKLDEALEHAETCIRLDPQWAKGYYRKGCILLEKNKFHNSISAFRLAKHYGAQESDLEKKIEYVNKQIRQQNKNVSNNNNTFHNLLPKFNFSLFTTSVFLVVLISIIAWFFVDISIFNSFKKFFLWLLDSYFGDIW